MNHVYEIDNGRLVSSTIRQVISLPNHLAVKSSDKTGIWNPQTLDFDPVPVKRVIDRQVFVDRFTEAEFDKISKAAQTNDKVESFIKRLMMTDTVDLDAVWLQNYVNRMETALIMGEGRAAEILNG